jgi:hypothetical protein
MDNFLDTCIILAKHDKKDKFHEGSKKFINNNNNFIISFYQDRKEIPFLFYRKERIITEAIKLSAIPTYQPSIENLTTKDKMILKQIITKLKLYDLSQQELFGFKRDLILLKQEINYFIKNKISRKVIHLEKIDLILKKRIYDKIKNEADSNIFCSAIQEHNENKLIIITNDVTDCKKENFIEAIKDTEYKEVPEIKYIF